MRFDRRQSPFALTTVMSWTRYKPLRFGNLGYAQKDREFRRFVSVGYAEGRPGWFSCRSACYLAAGRPVVMQDTGFAPVLPTGEGILSFSTRLKRPTPSDASNPTTAGTPARRARSPTRTLILTVC